MVFQNYVHIAFMHEGEVVSAVSKMPAPFIGRTDDPVDVQLAGTVHVFDTAGQRIATTDARFASCRRSGVGERRRAVDGEGEVVHVAVPPVLAGLVGLDERVVLRAEVGGRMPVRRVVAAADVAT